MHHWTLIGFVPFTTKHKHVSKLFCQTFLHTGASLTNVCQLQMWYILNPTENSVFWLSLSYLHSIKPGLEEVYFNEVYFATQTFSVTTRTQKVIERLGIYF